MTTYYTIQSSLMRLKNNRIFEAFVVAVIIISALEIGAKTYDLPDIAYSITAGLDIFITLFFLFEITIRFIAEPHNKDFFKSEGLVTGKDQQRQLKEQIRLLERVA